MGSTVDFEDGWPGAVPLRFDDPAVELGVVRGVEPDFLGGLHLSFSMPVGVERSELANLAFGEVFDNGNLWHHGWGAEDSNDFAVAHGVA